MDLADTYDVVVIGGGVNGTGIARDCALRGLKTLLVEKKDLSGGTTGTCSGMIHGGVRYLLYDVATTKHSCLDSGYIQRIAPHLLFRIPFLFPVLGGTRYSIELLETFFEAYDRFAPLKRGKPHTKLTREEALRLEPGLNPQIRGAVTFDEWGIDPFRLCTLNALAAREHGAKIRTHTEVIGFLKGDRGAVVGVRIRDIITGEVEDARARMTMNATGPWVPKICELAGTRAQLRPAKGIHLVFDRRLSNVGIMCNAIDGRGIFILPHENTTLVGTTDDDYYGDPDDIEITCDEIEYLLQGVERTFPSVRQARIVRVMAGVRPTLYEWRKYEDDLSRAHKIFDHSGEGVSGFASIAGGKLATYRLMAEEATDFICKKLGHKAKCRTHLEPLPGGESEVDIEEIAREYGLPLYAVRRLVYRHGCRCLDVLKDVKGSPRLASLTCLCEPVTEAEVRYAIRKEWARTLDDIRRRTRLGTGPCQAARCAAVAGVILGDELDLPTEQVHQHVVEFLQERWKGKRPILTDGQLVQEEINRAIHLSVANYEGVLRTLRSRCP